VSSRLALISPLIALVLGLGVTECRKPNPDAEAAKTADAGAIARPAASDPGAAACQRVAQVRDNCDPGKPCPQSRLDDFQQCAEYLRRAGLQKNPY
jgi:hypothetical protein